MRLAQFITASEETIIGEWEEFARGCVPAASAMDLRQRRDHIAGMLKAIALDLDTPQTAHEKAEKSKGRDDAALHGDTAANAHGIIRAAQGYTTVQMVAEFRALRASVQELWSQTQTEFRQTDIEELSRFNESIDQALAESTARYAQEVDRAKDLFLGILGHDLLDPLGAILAAASTMTKDSPAGLRSEAASSIVTSGKRMDATINELLDFTHTRLGTGIPLTITPTDMRVLCQKTVDEFVASHPGSVVRFEASGALKGAWDGERIAQALSALMTDAHQHGLPSSPVDVAVCEEPGGVVLTVHHQAPVIAQRELHNVFDPFRPGSVPPTASATSTPNKTQRLGLYITQAIVTAHLGTIHVTSAATGTTFTVRLPRSHDD